MMSSGTIEESQGALRAGGTACVSALICLQRTTSQSFGAMAVGMVAPTGWAQVRQHDSSRELQQDRDGRLGLVVHGAGRWR
jgi:hypothetical protein